VGYTGATGATFLQVQATKRRVVRQAGCPGKLQYTPTQGPQNIPYRNFIALVG